MTYLNPICADVGTRNCPCPLAETGDCLVCSRLSGRKVCDCRWAGVCVYNEYIQNGSKVRVRREDRSTEILQRLWRSDDLLLLQLAVPRGFALEASQPGSFLFLKAPGASELTNVPVSVMAADAEHGSIWVALKILSAKTKALAACEDFLDVRGVYRSGLLGKGLAGMQADGRKPGGEPLEGKAPVVESLPGKSLERDCLEEKSTDGNNSRGMNLEQNAEREKRAEKQQDEGKSMSGTDVSGDSIEEKHLEETRLLGELSKSEPGLETPDREFSTRKRWLILTKGVGFAPAINLIRWAAGRIDVHVIADPEKVGEDMIREQFHAWQLEKAGVEGGRFRLEFQSLAKLLDRLEAASPLPATDPHAPALSTHGTPVDHPAAPTLHQTNYDRIFLLASDYYIKRLSAAMKIPPGKLVFCNNFHLCCGEGICGACGYVDTAGNLSRMCKCREFSAQDLLLPEL